jgi:hypothetical protein
VPVLELLGVEVTDKTQAFHVNAKMIPVETVPGMWGEEDRRERWRG